MMKKGYELTKDCFDACLKNKTALCAFNFASLDIMKCICSVSAEKNIPVILQVSESAIAFIGGDYLKQLIKTAKKLYTVPLIFHLDHGKTFESVKNAIKLGFDSVMIDASSLSFEDNVSLTKKVCDYAHSKGVWVEAELGSLSGIEDDVNVSCDDAKFTNPQQAKDFVQKTGCDSLAIAIGTSHGAYKFKGESKLRMDILKDIENKLPDYPFVLHGASSVDPDYVALLEEYGGELKSAKGVDERLLMEASHNHNICKINMDTDLRIAFTAGIRKCLTENKKEIDQRKYVGLGCEFVKKIISSKIDRISGGFLLV